MALGSSFSAMPRSSSIDVAQYILKTFGPMTAMKLQKLVYYAQAWSLVWDEAPLFREAIQAWDRGPVVWELYTAHRGQFMVAEIPGRKPASLPKNALENIQKVWDYYGKMSAQQLSDLTHLEQPWNKMNMTGETTGCSRFG
jgi:uncharacterized phage-associated protein